MAEDARSSGPLAVCDESVRVALVRATHALAAVSPTPRLDAELLMAHALGVDRDGLLLGPLDRRAPDAFTALLARRLASEPVAYVTGTRGFWTIDLAVGPAVLVPRADSETLIEAAVDHFGTRGPAGVLDLGTGSGALLLAALDQWRDATGLGIDIEPAALKVAACNADRLGLAARAAFRLGDWGECIAEPFDLILCNPPYIESGAALPAEVVRYEPASALFAGSDGLAAYRRIAPQLLSLLTPDGLACVEIGAAQAASAAALFVAEGLSVAVRRDLAGRDRCLVIRR